MFAIIAGLILLTLGVVSLTPITIFGGIMMILAGWYIETSE